MFLSLSDDVLALFDKQNVEIRVFKWVLQREWEKGFCTGSTILVIQFIFLLHVYKYLFGLYTFEC